MFTLSRNRVSVLLCSTIIDCKSLREHNIFDVFDETKAKPEFEIVVAVEHFIIAHFIDLIHLMNFIDSGRD